MRKSVILPAAGQSIKVDITGNSLVVESALFVNNVDETATFKFNPGGDVFPLYSRSSYNSIGGFTSIEITATAATAGSTVVLVSTLDCVETRINIPDVGETKDILIEEDFIIGSSEISKYEVDLLPLVGSFRYLHFIRAIAFLRNMNAGLGRLARIRIIVRFSESDNRNSVFSAIAPIVQPLQSKMNIFYREPFFVAAGVGIVQYGNISDENFSEGQSLNSLTSIDLFEISELKLRLLDNVNSNSEQSYKVSFQASNSPLPVV